MNDDDVPRVMETRRDPALEGLLIIIKRTVPDAHDRARINVAHAKVHARVRACVRRCTHGRMRISAIAIDKSSEPFITLISTLILNRRHELPRAAQKKRADCLFHPCKKFMNEARICMPCHRHSGPLRKLSSRQPRHAFRAHLFFTFSPIESYYNSTILLL